MSAAFEAEDRRYHAERILEERDRQLQHGAAQLTAETHAFHARFKEVSNEHLAAKEYLQGQLASAEGQLLREREALQRA